MKTARIVLILLALLLVSANAFAATVSIPSTNGDSGASVQIPINAEWEIQLTAFQFTITFDPNVITCNANATKGSLISAWSLTTNYDLPGQIGVLGNDSAGTGIAPGVGNLVNLNCTVANNPGASTALAFAGVNVLVDVDINEYTPATSSGTFTINGGCTPSTEICDGVDNDCDQQIDEGITAVPTTCGVGACASTGQSICQAGQMVNSCTPDSPSTETCNSIDDNCDGTIDNGIAAVPTTCGVGACASTGQSICQGGQMVDTCSPSAPQTEGPFGNATCSDSSDNDCDGSTDAADSGCVQQCTPSTEVCDGVDNDCDGQIDEGVKNTYYRDADSDTFGIPNNTTQACTPPQGYVSNNTDCNDSNPAVKPGAAEICDGVDNNCDGSVDNGIASAPTTCGVGACASTGQSTCQGGQMLNSCTPGIPQTEGPFGNPTCSDSSDNDCDGTTDSADSGCSQQCTPSTEVCDGVDNDCDGQIDEEIAAVPTSCGVGACASTGQSICQAGQMVNSCTPGTPQVEGPFGNLTCSDSSDNDCDTTTDAADSGCAEVCTPSTEVCDGVDNDCDGQIDEEIAAVPTNCGIGACASTGQSTCQGGQMIDTCSPSTPQTEGPFGNLTCSDSSDNDCDGTTDSADSGCADVCTPSTEVCDGIDNDCDGQIDEEIAAVPTSCGVGACASTGQSTCQGGQMVDSCSPGVPSGETCNGIDENCDGKVDNGITPFPTTCGIGACASTGQFVCQDGQRVNTCTPGAPQTEGPWGDPTCSDSIDNDCDGSTDKDAGCLIQPGDMSQWVGKWFIIKENGQMPGQSGITFSAPDSKFIQEKHNGSRKGYMHIWNWDPDSKFLRFDYYAFIKDEGIWDIYTSAIQFFSGTDMKFLFLYYHRPDRNQLITMNGVIEGKMKKGLLQSATLKTFGGYHLEVSGDNTLYTAGEEAITGKMIDASKVPVPLNVIIPR